MADGTKIEWTDATWNPITGCEIKSPGCTNCYAMKLAGTRLQHHPSRAGLTTMTKAGPVWNGEVRFNEQWLDQPRRWLRPRMIFVCAHGDLFAPGVRRHWQDQIFGVMMIAQHHIFQVLTKRPGEMLDYIQSSHIRPMPHVWLGCSVEDQPRADERYGAMKRMAELGWLTWVSYEPAIGPVNWRGWEFLRWMVSGGESDTDGRSARPTHPQWHRDARDFCEPTAIAYNFKQWGAFVTEDQSPEDIVLPGEARLPWSVYDDDKGEYHGDRTAVYRVGKKRAGRLLDGIEHNGFPVAA